MRNPFDQYSQPENRLTHALLTSLAMDRKALRRFVMWATRSRSASKELKVLEQTLPGEAETISEEDADHRGIPDGCIWNGVDWALLIESKLTATVSNKQLQNHLRTAARHGINRCTVLLLTVQKVKRRLPDGVLNQTWSEVYLWLMRRPKNSLWMNIAAKYIETVEARNGQENCPWEGTLTVFSGIPFGEEEPYTYQQAKRLLRLLVNQLLKDKDLQKQLGVDPNSKGRKKITGRGGTRVWDFISLKSSTDAEVFTRSPHLTVSLHDTALEALVTIPNGIRSLPRKKILGNTYKEFERLIQTITRQLVHKLRLYPGSAPMIVVVQRRYKTQASAATVDGLLEFDPRVAFQDKRSAKKQAKYQPQWLQLAYDLLKHRRSNLQFQIGAKFPYQSCKVVATKEVEKAVVNSLLACKQLIQ